jgi:hypothetical protein
MAARLTSVDENPVRRIGKGLTAETGGPALAFPLSMLISLFPRVTGLKLENAWGRGSGGMVLCTARLSRPLRPEEWERVDRLPGTSAEGDEVVHECRPEEVEGWHTQLVEALGGPSASGERRASAAGQRPARPARKRRGGRRPGPAA